MSRLSRLTFSTLIFATLAMGATVQAATYYVSTTGSDGSPGTIATPWRTVTHAAATMICGDTTYVRGGTYASEVTIKFARTNCTAQTPITLQAYPGESPVIHWPSKSNSASKISLYSGNFANPVTDVIIDGFELWGGFEGIKLEGALRTIIRNNIIHGHYTNGITGAGAGGTNSVTVTRNRIYDNGDYTSPQCNGDLACNQFHGLYIEGQNWTITNNLIYDNLGYGIQLDGQVATSSSDTSLYGGFSGIIANNTFAYQRNRCGIVLWGNGQPPTNTVIENNIFYENSQNNGYSQALAYSGSCISGACSAIIRNNIWYGTGNASIFGDLSTPAGVTISNSINANPNMVNAPATLPASPNFSLTESSPAIDAGVTEPLVTIDFVGTLRPQGSRHDIGAYEGTGQPNNLSPAAPTGLTIF